MFSRSKPLIAAVKSGDIAKMEKLSKKSGFTKDVVKEFDKNGYSPLTLAAFLGTPKMLETILEANGDINARDKNNCTPLFVAAQNDHPLVVKVLSKYETLDIEAKCTDGKTANDVANSGTGGPDILKYIGNVEGLKLVTAGKKGDLDAVKHLVTRPMINLEASDTTGWTALHFAMKNDFEEMVEVLAAAGADGEYKNMAGATPLSLAQSAGNQAIIKLYNDTVEGVGRLAKKEREREKEPEKKIGVLKKEGVATAVFAHKKFSDDELVALQMKVLAEVRREEKDKAEGKVAVDKTPSSPGTLDIQVKGGWSHMNKKEGKVEEAKNETDKDTNEKKVEEEKEDNEEDEDDYDESCDSEEK